MDKLVIKKNVYRLLLLEILLLTMRQDHINQNGGTFYKRPNQYSLKISKSWRKDRIVKD